MIQVLEFCKQYWKEIAAGLIFLFEVVILVVKKKPIKVIDTFMTELYEIVINSVTLVEEKVGSGQGSNKKKLVLELVKKAFNDKYGLSIDMDAVLDLASCVIEQVLSTPQKKGD